MSKFISIVYFNKKQSMFKCVNQRHLAAKKGTDRVLVKNWFLKNHPGKQNSEIYPVNTS